MSIYEALTGLIGQPPPGYEIVVWVVCAVTFVYTVTCAFGIIGSVFKWIAGGKR